MERRAAKRVAIVVGSGAAATGAWVGIRVSLRLAAMGRDMVRFCYGAATLRLYRRCPDCRRWIRGDAHVCWRCGYRKRSQRRWAAR